MLHRRLAILSPALAALIAAVLALHACGGAERRTPHVVIMLIDTLRADRLGVYGHGHNTSPVIDALARESVVFDSCYSPAPWTLPSVVSLQTSTFPSEHQVLIEGQKTPLSMPTLAERLQDDGYATASFFANAFAGPMSGLNRGYDRCDYNPATDAPTVDQWIKSLQPGPSYLYVHNVEPHDPYFASQPAAKLMWTEHLKRIGSPPRTPTANRKRIEGLWTGYRHMTKVDFVRKIPVGTTDNSEGQTKAMAKIAEHEEFINVLYDAAVRDADSRVGRIINTLAKNGRWDDTLFILLSDHGEELGDHGGWQHDQSLYDELVRVPLMIRFPKGAPFTPKRISQPVSLVDIVPTIMDYMGSDADPNTRGRSLLPLIEQGSGDEAELRVTSMRVNLKKFYRPYKEQRGDLNVVVRQGAWKGIWNAEPATLELYDLREDPAEQRDVSADHQELATSMKDHAVAWLDEGRARAADVVVPPQEALTEEQIERLRSLGYVK